MASDLCDVHRRRSDIAGAEDPDTVAIVTPWALLPKEEHRPAESSRRMVADLNAIPNGSEQLAFLSNDANSTERGDVVDRPEPADLGSMSETELLEELGGICLLDFNPAKPQPPESTIRRRPRVRRVTQPARNVEPPTQQRQFAALANQADLVGLPILNESECQKSPEDVAELARLSRGMASLRLRAMRSSRLRAMSFSGSVFSLSDELQMETELGRVLFEKSQPHARSVAPLVQILQVKSVRSRFDLVDLLSSIDGPEASHALADRALFDLSADVRIAATQHLQRRDRDEFRSRLLTALRYPWPPAAYHAAKALVALRDTDSISKLEALLDELDPRQPFVAEDDTWMKTELVRVNHLRNCLLCHPRSVSPRDRIRAAVPTPGRPLPALYYQASSSDVVHADVTFLRQDFSIMQPVADVGPWPGMQRFDFLVRTRPLTDDEVSQQAQRKNGSSHTYPQREAVSTALQRLSKW